MPKSKTKAFNDILQTYPFAKDAVAASWALLTTGRGEKLAQRVVKEVNQITVPLTEHTLVDATLTILDGVINHYPHTLLRLEPELKEMLQGHIQIHRPPTRLELLRKT